MCHDLFDLSVLRFLALTAECLKIKSEYIVVDLWKQEHKQEWYLKVKHNNTNN